jgi:hypothetical protein
MMIAKALQAMILIHSANSIKGEMSEHLFSSRVLKDTPPGYPNCKVNNPSLIGDGYCYGYDYNTEQCGWDGGDCIEFNEKYPNCKVDSPSFIGDGFCYGGDYNTEECGWEGGDCESFNEKYPNCKVYLPSLLIGDGFCDGDYFNTEECGWDGGDCESFNEKYPNCKVYPPLIGDGFCYGAYNTEECGWDGGDCPSSSVGRRLLGIDYLVHIIQLGSFLVCLSYA